MAGLKILIIDDEQLIQAQLRAYLDQYAAEILELDNGRHVMSVIESQSPDLVITDLFMPDKDGLEVIREVKDKYPSLPVYAISAHSEYIDIASDMGADEIFPKPIDTVRLVDCIKSL